MLGQHPGIERRQQPRRGVGGQPGHVEDPDVRGLAGHGRGGQLGVVGEAPGQGGGLDLDRGVRLGEIRLHLHHAHAVAAAEQIPVGEILGGCGLHDARGHRGRRGHGKPGGGRTLQEGTPARGVIRNLCRDALLLVHQCSPSKCSVRLRRAGVLQPKRMRPGTYRPGAVLARPPSCSRGGHPYHAREGAGAPDASRAPTPADPLQRHSRDAVGWSVDSREGPDAIPTAWNVPAPGWPSVPCIAVAAGGARRLNVKSGLTLDNDSTAAHDCQGAAGRLAGAARRHPLARHLRAGLRRAGPGRLRGLLRRLGAGGGAGDRWASGGPRREGGARLAPPAGPGGRPWTWGAPGPVANRLVLAQVAVAAGSNEIPALPALLRLLALRGCIVTIDAIGCQTAIAQAIHGPRSGLRARAQGRTRRACISRVGGGLRRTRRRRRWLPYRHTTLPRGGQRARAAGGAHHHPARRPGPPRLAQPSPGLGRPGRPGAGGGRAPPRQRSAATRPAII